VRNRGKVLGAWGLALVVLIGLVQAVGGEFVDSFTIPGAESQRAVDLLEERFPSQSGDTATIVVRADAGVTDPTVRSRVEALVTEAATLPEVVGVGSPYDTPGAISADGSYAYATVQYAAPANEVDRGNTDRLLELVDRSAGEGMVVEVGGPVGLG
jgi:RND superfamily putative drug exporter